MTSYLTSPELGTLINLGKIIEVFLGGNNEDNEVISWFDLKKVNHKIQVTYYEISNKGSLDWLDLYAFSFVDPDINFKTKKFNNAEETVKYIRKENTFSEPKF